VSSPLRGRLVVVVAAAGYGKTAAVRRWVRDDDDVLVVDGEPAPAGDLSGVHRLVLVSRRPRPVADLLRYDRGAPVEIGPRHLALAPAQVAALLADEYGVTDAELAADVHRRTAGWPMLTHLVGAALGSGVDRRAIAAVGTAAHDYIAGEILSDLSACALELLATAAEVGSVSADLLAVLPQQDAVPALGLLVRTGLLIPMSPGGDRYRPVPLVAEVARTIAPLPPAKRAATVALAADWHTEHGSPADALRLAVASGDHTRCAHLLGKHGDTLVADGSAAEVIAGIMLLPPDLRSPPIQLLLADALQATGDTAGALAVYADLAGDEPELAPEVAWRYGAAIYLWGDSHAALAVLRRGRLGAGAPADDALLLAWTAAAHWLAGEEDACRDHADRALRTARASGNDRALAAAHVAQALCAHLAGDPVALRANYSRALQLAEDCGDTVQALRIRVNLAAALEQQGELADALAMLGPAIAVADAAGYDGSLALALANEGALLHRLGRLDDAAASYRRAIGVYERMHSRKVAYPLTGLGDLHRSRGQRAQAMAAYLEALRAATEDGNNRQGMVPALVGLAHVADDGAEEFARRAVEHASGHWLTEALLARAHVAGRAGTVPDVARDAAAAVDAAMLHRDRTGLARALEVRATTEAPAPARRSLEEALAIWTDTGAILDADRVRVALGRLAGQDSDQRLVGRLAESRLAAAGVAVPLAPAADAPVEIRVLGGFTVLIDGEPVPPAGWQSRKARELLRILVARRGRPASRDELAELLWGPIAPADQDKVGHRLSVALSTLRAVLDPGRVVQADHFVVASQAHVAVDLARVRVDVEEFFARARYGVRLHERGETADAWTVLTAAEQAYTGEAFADDPYADWARPLRAEAHATYLHVLRTLVELSQRAGDVDDVVRNLLRIVTAEPYDEQAHRDLVSTLRTAGRHGEAARAFERYAAAMREIGVRL
jgi:DNA-binding SARP family transcriptional activator/Tfp pilus assembly protein PilF